jgi:hypothetical protein
MVATVIEKLVGDKSWVEEKPGQGATTAERTTPVLRAKKESSHVFLRTRQPTRLLP